MGKTNTCIIYDKLQQSSDILSSIEYGDIKITKSLISIEDNIKQMSQNNDNIFKTALLYLSDAKKHIQGDFDDISKLSQNIVGAIDSFNAAEGKVDKDKFSSYIQNINLIDEETKNKIKENGFETYYSKEKLQLTEEEAKILEKKKVNIEEITNSTVSSWVDSEYKLTLMQQFTPAKLLRDTDQIKKDLLTNSFTTASAGGILLDLTSSLEGPKTPVEFLEEVTGPYSKEGLKNLLKKEYPLLTHQAVEDLVNDHLDKTAPSTKEEVVTPTEDVQEESSSNSNYSYNSNSNSNVSYRRSSISSSSNSSINSQNINDIKDLDNSIKKSSTSEQPQNQSIESKQTVAIEEQSNQDSQTSTIEENIHQQNQGVPKETQNSNIEEQDQQQNQDVPKDTQSSNVAEQSNTPVDKVKNTLSKVSKELTASISEGQSLESKDPIILDEYNTPKDEYFPTSYNDSTTQDGMLTYSNTSSQINTAKTKSGGIAPAVVGLGLAGTASIATNKIIHKQEKKQIDKINSIEKESKKEERRFIPLDAINTEEDNSNQEEQTHTGDIPDEKADWSKYIKELY